MNHKDNEELITLRRCDINSVLIMMTGGCQDTVDVAWMTLDNFEVQDGD